jgi:lipopolysaccharide export system protein LptA
LVTLVPCFSAGAAERQPINIEADNAKIIEKEGKSVYKGNVLLIQGTTRMTADIVTVYSRDNKLVRIIAKGSPVTYHKSSTAESEDLSGQANVLEYLAEQQRIVLTEGAKLTQGRTAFSGNRIEYNIKTDVVTAQTSESGKERVQVTIQPEKANKPKSGANKP